MYYLFLRLRYIHHQYYRYIPDVSINSIQLKHAPEWRKRFVAG